VKTVRLHEIVPTWLEGSRWKPIRSLLDIQAFGVNAYVADAGEQLVAEHVEVGGLAGTQRHEELYVVVAGRAAFKGANGEVDAPTGTLVFFDNPAELRAARAVDDETTVIAIGAPVGEPYRIAPWEYWFRVRRALHEGDRAMALTIADECVERYPQTAGLFADL
jgi:hypothetical protein